MTDRGTSSVGELGGGGRGHTAAAAGSSDCREWRDIPCGLWIGVPCSLVIFALSLVIVGGDCYGVSCLHAISTADPNGVPGRMVVLYYGVQAYGLNVASTWQHGTKTIHSNYAAGDVYTYSLTWADMNLAGICLEGAATRSWGINNGFCQGTQYVDPSEPTRNAVIAFTLLGMLFALPPLLFPIIRCCDNEWNACGSTKVGLIKFGFALMFASFICFIIAITVFLRWDLIVQAQVNQPHYVPEEIGVYCPYQSPESCGQGYVPRAIVSISKIQNSSLSVWGYTSCSDLLVSVLVLSCFGLLNFANLWMNLGRICLRLRCCCCCWRTQHVVKVPSGDGGSRPSLIATSNSINGNHVNNPHHHNHNNNTNQPEKRLEMISV